MSWSQKSPMSVAFNSKGTFSLLLHGAVAPGALCILDAAEEAAIARDRLLSGEEKGADRVPLELEKATSSHIASAKASHMAKPVE